MPAIVTAPEPGAEYVYVAKVETDSLDPTRVLVLVLYDIHRKLLYVFSDQPGATSIATGAEVASLADLVIVHSPYVFSPGL